MLAYVTQLVTWQILQSRLTSHQSLFHAHVFVGAILLFFKPNVAFYGFKIP